MQWKRSGQATFTGNVYRLPAWKATFTGNVYRLPAWMVDTWTGNAHVMSVGSKETNAMGKIRSGNVYQWERSGQATFTNVYQWKKSQRMLGRQSN
jgi:hypothetical protein